MPSWRRGDVQGAGPDDAPDIARLLATCLPDAWTEVMVRDTLQAGAFGLLLRKEALLGCALARVAGDEAEVFQLAVDAAWRRNGLGSFLLAMTTAECIRRGALSLWLEVAAGNGAARALYAREGFGEEGFRRRYYASGEDAVVMRRELRFPLP